MIILLVLLIIKLVKIQINRKNPFKNIYSIIIMSNEGYIYCISNPIFKGYGDNVYKLGRTCNLKSRMHGYITSFVEPCKYELTSKKLNDSVRAEKLLFNKLSKCRVNSSREFFNCDLYSLTKIFTEIEDQIGSVGEKVVVKAVVKKAVKNKIINIDKPIHKKNNIKSNHSCTLCNKYYSSYQSLWIHNKKYHKTKDNHNKNEKTKLEKKFTCRFCNHMFTRKNNMVVHINETCKIAYKDKQEKIELKNKLLELKNVVTKIKSKTKFNKDDIVDNVIPLEKTNTTTDNKNNYVKSDYTCTLCNKDYSSYQSLWIHNKKYHKTKHNNTNIQSENKVKSEKKFTCRFCNHMFTRKNNMVMHIKEKCKLADKDKYEKDELKNKVLELTKVVHQLQAKTK
jgi:hypothetical protein